MDGLGDWGKRKSPQESPVSNFRESPVAGGTQETQQQLRISPIGDDKSFDDRRRMIGNRRREGGGDSASRREGGGDSAARREGGGDSAARREGGGLIPRGNIRAGQGARNINREAMEERRSQQNYLRLVLYG